MIYKALYKCRYCDSVFQGGVTTNQYIPTMVMAEFCCGKQIANNQGIRARTKDRALDRIRVCWK